jgi:nucleoside 2-deoxyribosyltransferase
MECQDYRGRIAAVLQAHMPEVEIWDPNQLHPDGVNYSREEAKRTLVEMAVLAARADCLIAYVPEASMGTAIEMWQAYRAGVPVYTISPLTENWVIFTLSTEVFSDLETFAGFVAAGGLDRGRKVA